MMRIVLLGCLGPAMTLCIVWYPVLSFVRVPAGSFPSPEVVRELISAPSDAVLDDLHEFAVGFPGFKWMSDSEAVRAADDLLSGDYKLDGIRLRVPSADGDFLSDTYTAHLDIVSFLAPSLLLRAYEASGYPGYIEASVQYVLDWSEFESSLYVPRGLVFNDHAIAARSIVVTELWRQYRNSALFDSATAQSLLGYAQILSRRMLDERLFEYRSNHGVMQSLALIHLATGFPLLPDSETLLHAGISRLEAQLGYFVNAEGVVLEHSASYHWNGVRRLSAAWRYFGLNDVATPTEMIDRYRAARHFAASLRRPDGTLPPIGDTRTIPYIDYLVAEFNEAGIVEHEMRWVTADELVPDPVTLKAGAGYAVYWDGLENWPESAGLVQTVLHWGNFPTRVHKHADEFGLSIWANGTQWIRSVGSWPYISSRPDAIGWRSSNAPHFQGESSYVERTSVVEAYIAADDVIALDLRRTNEDGRSVRRQLVKLGSDVWVAVDSFDGLEQSVGEVLWRFGPDVSLREEGPGQVVAKSGEHALIMTVSDFGAPGTTVDTDGRADWNRGLVDGDTIVPSAAVRVQTSEKAEALATLLVLGDARKTEIPDRLTLEWHSATRWTLSADSGGRDTLVVKREGNSVSVGREGHRTEVALEQGPPDGAQHAEELALAAYERASIRYDDRFVPMTVRRKKVSVVVLLAAVAQIALFIIVARRRRSWWPPLFVASSVAWVGLISFLVLSFLG